MFKAIFILHVHVHCSNKLVIRILKKIVQKLEKLKMKVIFRIKNIYYGIVKDLIGKGYYRKKKNQKDGLLSWGLNL